MPGWRIRADEGAGGKIRRARGEDIRDDRLSMPAARGSRIDRRTGEAIST
jgi:hypothetical protein